MNRTDIQWTWTLRPDGTWEKGSTWNPLKGCRRKSPGCERCYAERLIATRLRRLPMYQGLATMTKNGPRFTGEHRLDPDALDAPLRARKGRKVFVNDLGDLFFEEHPFEEIAQVFAVMALAQQHTFQVLTKRIERAREFLTVWAAGGRHIWEAAQDIEMPRGHDKPSPGWPLPNVWIGASVEDVPRKARIDVLRDLPAVVRFLSIEPLLEDLGELDLTGIDWAIVGGESGPGARPFDIAWPRKILAQCRAQRVAPFIKQMGANPQDHGTGADWPTGVSFRQGVGPGSRVILVDGHGGNPEEWPTDARIREFPTPRSMRVAA